jgi:acetylornithine deacetylase/succinyl-diaminopimelate desuccinylase-like protein
MLKPEVESYITAHEAEALDLLKTLAQIPSPSNHEEKRAEFIRDWLLKQGAQGVFIDKACNVIYPVGLTETNRVSAFMAHIDVVFPDMEPLPLHTEGGKLYAPGVGDDTANVAALLMVAKYVTEKKLRPLDGKGVLFVANSGEEGLGNLRGSKAIGEAYGSRMDQLISFDGKWDGITNKAVGSKRYEVSVKTEGGHSYNNFGNRNAIAYLASMIGTLYALKAPTGGKTTYNVGTITGGTSVNSIAEDASMLYEYRSDSREDLAFMDKHFDAVIAAYKTKGIGVSVKLVGERPCSGDVDQKAEDALFERARTVIKEYTGTDAKAKPGSTDANIPLSKGIPAVTFGCLQGARNHTRGEWLEIESLKPGYRIAFTMVLDKFA